MKLALATTVAILVATAGGAVHAQSQTGEGAVTVTRSSVSLYPELRPAELTPPVQRACTQLEIGAGIPAEECGHHTLGHVASEFVDATSK